MKTASMTDFYKITLLPASILIGTTIGAGMFSLPFIFKATGLATGFFYLLFLGLVYACLYYFFADLILRTSGAHRIVGLAKIYLGKPGFWLTIFSSLFQQFFVLAIYLILAPSFSRFLLGGDYWNHLLAFWAIGSAIILFNVRRIALFEFLINAGMVLIIALIFLWGMGNFPANVLDNWKTLDFSKFAAVGPILFALSGTLAIPEVIDYFREAKIPVSYLKKSILVGAAVPVVAYILFVLGVLGISGAVSEDSVSGLIGNLPDFLLIFVGILGIFSLISSYIVIGLNSRRMLELDIGLPDIAAKILVVVIPLLLYVGGLKDFIDGINFVGSIFLPLDGILIIFMWLRMNKISEKPVIVVGRMARLSIPVILLVFVAAILYFLF